MSDANYILELIIEAPTQRVSIRVGRTALYNSIISNKKQSIE